MTITVNSPFTGRPVKIREKDVGRAVTDEDGGIFYVLPKADGSGYYGAPTRHGGEKDELRAADHDARTHSVRDGGGGGDATRQGYAGSRGVSRPASRSGGGKVLAVIVLILLGVGAWAVFFGPLKGMLSGLTGAE